MSRSRSQIQNTLKLAEDERRADMLRLTEPRSEICAADEEPYGLDCKGQRFVLHKAQFQAAAKTAR